MKLNDIYMFLLVRKAEKDLVVMNKILQINKGTAFFPLTLIVDRIDRYNKCI